jgi:hypothetical protein
MKGKMRGHPSPSSTATQPPPPPPRARTASSPIREKGLPPRACETPPKTDQRRTRGNLRWGTERAHHLQTWERGESRRHTGPVEQGDEGVIQEFFGQLWFVPESFSPHTHRHHHSHRHGSRVDGEPIDNLVWIRKSLWESKGSSLKTAFKRQKGICGRISRSNSGSRRISGRKGKNQPSFKLSWLEEGVEGEEELGHQA